MATISTCRICQEAERAIERLMIPYSAGRSFAPDAIVYWRGQLYKHQQLFHQSSESGQGR